MRIAAVVTWVLMLLVVSSGANAQSPIGPFSGSASETFESFALQSQQLFVDNPTPVFGGHGVLTVSGPENAVKAIAIYSPADNSNFGNYLPIDGIKYAISQNFADSLSFMFDSPGTKFGGYFGQAPEDGSSVGLPLSFTFYDANDAIVGGGNFLPTAENDDSMVWLGLQTSMPFVRVDISPGQPALILMDGLQTDVPEPTSASILLAALVGMPCMSRRRGRGD